MAHDCSKEPCPLCRARAEGIDCGCARAGLVVDSETGEVQRCDACGLFDGDDDAAAAVDELLKMLGRVYRERSDWTVADALDSMEARLSQDGGR